jgi:hypothetical protein
MKLKKITRYLILAGILAGPFTLACADEPEQVFTHPPESAQPGVWWHWMGCNVSKEGITRDLEAFKAAGFSSATIFGMADVCTPWAGHIENSPAKGLVAFTDPWWQLVRHAAAEGKRLGIDVGVHNCPGYESSGGPWITPELSMQEVCISQTPVEGGAHFNGLLPCPHVDPHGANMPMYSGSTGKVESPEILGRATYFQDIAVLAMPAEGVVTKEQIIDLSKQMNADGRLEWTVPPGKWVIYRIGHTTTGALTQPNQWEIHGLECDKMSVKAVEFHMNHLLADLQRNLGGLVGTGLKHVLFDSYEAGTPSWTPLMPSEFAQRRGYDLTPFLATFAGRAVGSQAETDKFKADFSRTIQELYRDNYFPTVQRLLHTAGLRFNCEPYTGPWVIGEAAPHVDRVMTEFWNGAAFGGAPMDGIFNAGDGKLHNILEAEAFTGGPGISQWNECPASLKAVGDGAFCAGINRFVLHGVIHQPWDDRYRPGNSMGQWGTHFGRLQTWWEPGKAWVAYLQRCQALLQLGGAAPKNFSVESGLAVNGIHRHGETADVWFLANPGPGGGVARCRFKVTGKQPELWDPVTGAMRDLPDFADANGETALTLEFAPAQSWFVVFGKAAAKRTSGAVNFPVLKPMGEIAGPWEVSFDPKWGGPKVPVKFDTLTDWTRNSDPGIKYYSGTAIYRKTFDLDAEQLKTANQNSKIFLAFGAVNQLARVRLNGNDLGVVWCAPWRVAIPVGALKPKDNQLEIEVTNTWANRLIGDEQEPADCEWLPGFQNGGCYLKKFPDWFVKGEARPSKGRYCFVTWNYFTKDSPLTPSGLAGPVTLVVEEQ